jgi:hypothetical protein
MPKKTKKELSQEAYNKKYYADGALADAEMKKALEKEPLLYCRFCNHKPGDDGPELVRTQAHVAWVMCNRCGAQGPSAYHETKIPGLALKAIRYWNNHHK